LDNSKPLVVLENCKLSLGRSGSQQVEFSLEKLQLRKGEQVALTGPSGCGKSTCLNLVSGLLKPDSGSIIVEGTNIEKLNPRAMDRFRGEKIGFVYQTFHLLDAFSALENVLIGLRFARQVPNAKRKAAAKEALEKVSLAHRIHSKPSSMSVGEKQRVAIARALSSSPSLLLADEPTGSLDPNTGADVFELLTSLCRERDTTLMFVTHDLDLASKLDRQVDCRGFVQTQGAMVS